MPSHPPEPEDEVIPGPGRRSVSGQGRAYCGPAHGQQWPVIGLEPPARVEVRCGASSALYRLVRQPRTGRPAHDQLGNFLYVPMAGEHSVPPADTDARVIPFPPGGRPDGSR